MKQMFKRVLKRFVLTILNELNPVLETFSKNNESVAQKALIHQYRLLASRGNEWLPDFRDVGFRKYSQFEEDGILLYIFALIPPINRTCIEICAGNGRECNTANLIINHGWWGHLFDGNKQNVKAGIGFFRKDKDTFIYPPRFTNAWITAENVNGLIEQSGVSGPIDLLSLDIDGMDYWVWKAISVIEPQVVVCETLNSIPPDKALTVPYDPNFVFESEDYRGASLAAMCKLGRNKGYRLIGTHRFGFNAFFMKNGLGEEFFPEVEPSSCVNDPYSIVRAFVQR
ncbi:MAG: hypothetical protein JRJ65_10705 [Deltaproteobacteria bacterium]|nr:hypothetical protein [Deltaproteobacteria bacterium]